MAERQRLVESLVGRPVQSLRDLNTLEAQGLLADLHQRASMSSTNRESPGSSWDTRDGDTWIDRL